MKALAAGLGALIELCAGWASPTAAAPITFAFTGSVTQTNFDPADPFGGSIVFGTPFSGSYTFESTTADAIPAADTGSYTSPSGTPFEFTVTIGGNAFSAVDFLNVGVADGLVDQYTVLACSGDPACPDLMLELFFEDSDAGVFVGDALPLLPPPFAAFELATFTLRGTVAGNQVEILGQVTSLVPEPSTLLLCTGGLAVLGWRGGRRRPASGE